MVYDADEGLNAAIGRLLEATRHRCKAHFTRTALSHAQREQNQMVAAIIRTAFAMDNREDAGQQWREAADRLRDRFPKIAALMDEDEVLAFIAYPKEQRGQISNANPLDRFKKEIKRRSGVIGLVPKDDVISRLVGALMIEEVDEMKDPRRDMNKEGLARIRLKDGRKTWKAA